MTEKSAPGPVAIRGAMEALESKLDAVMKERRTIETAIKEAEKRGQALHKRSSEIDAEEGTLRKQIGDLQNSLRALEA